jgi:hypothetical protein
MEYDALRRDTVVILDAALLEFDVPMVQLAQAQLRDLDAAWDRVMTMRKIRALFKRDKQEDKHELLEGITGRGLPLEPEPEESYSNLDAIEFAPRYASSGNGAKFSRRRT